MTPDPLRSLIESLRVQDGYPHRLISVDANDLTALLDAVEALDEGLKTYADAAPLPELLGIDPKGVIQGFLQKYGLLAAHYRAKARAAIKGEL
jgi:hypothetical protein